MVVCSLCKRDGHLKKDCPEDFKKVQLNPLPPVTPEFLGILNKVCEQCYSEYDEYMYFGSEVTKATFPPSGCTGSVRYDKHWSSKLITDMHFHWQWISLIKLTKIPQQQTKERMEDIQYILLFRVGIWLFITQSRRVLFQKRVHAARTKTV